MEEYYREYKIVRFPRPPRDKDPLELYLMNMYGVEETLIRKIATREAMIHFSNLLSFVRNKAGDYSHVCTLLEYFGKKTIIKADLVQDIRTKIENHVREKKEPII